MHVSNLNPSLSDSKAFVLSNILLARHNTGTLCVKSLVCLVFVSVAVEVNRGCITFLTRVLQLDMENLT